jgi:uncharacterized membrane protein
MEAVALILGRLILIAYILIAIYSFILTWKACCNAEKETDEHFIFSDFLPKLIIASLFALLFPIFLGKIYYKNAFKIGESKDDTNTD